jgi:crossover junction endodeoxyribonuclease RuvC
MANATTHAPGAQPLIVLGIDPGTRIVGYGAVVVHPSGPKLLTAGVIRVGAKDGVPERLAAIHGRLTTLMAEMRPQVVVVERAFAAKNIQSALRIGEGRGLALACAAACGAAVVEMAPRAAKKRVVGSGSAEKEQVAHMVRRTLGREDLDLPLDATDALALALAHVLRPTVIVPASGTKSRSAKVRGSAGLPAHVLDSARRFWDGRTPVESVATPKPRKGDAHGRS